MDVSHHVPLPRHLCALSQDRVLVQGFKIGDGKCLLVLVCDGHGGPHCAAYATQQFGKLMEPFLPKRLPDWSLALGKLAAL
jgi:serine/threonine protein phosphatase PrpC